MINWDVLCEQATSNQWRSIFAKDIPKEMWQEFYDAYLRSKAWQRKRSACLEGIRSRCSGDSVPGLVAAVEHYRRRVKELEAALRPFAEFAVAMPGMPDATYVAVWDYGERPPPNLTVGHCRAARKALEGKS
jgi:hypothetical protein